MISMILLTYIGFAIDAPWWYFALTTFACLVRILNAGIKLGKEVGDSK